MSLVFDMGNLPRVTNRVYYPLYFDTTRYQILKGGAGSGKSQFIATNLLNKIVDNIKKGNVIGVLALRKHATTSRTSTFTLFSRLIAEWGWSGVVRTNIVTMTFTFPNGSFIRCGGLDDPEKLKSLEGIHIIWMEEANQFTYEDFKQVQIRLRGITRVPYQFIISFNPVNKFWVWDHFYKEGGLEPQPGDIGLQRIKRRGDVLSLTTTYKDNRWIDYKYKETLEKYSDYDYNYYRVYTLGEWGTTENAIFTHFEVERITYRFVDYDQYAAGLDFGVNHPSAMERSGFRDDSLYVYNEPIYESDLTNQDLIDSLGRVSLNPRERIIADSAEPGRIEDISRAGFRIEGAQKGPNSVNDWIDWAKRRRFVVDPSCTGLIEELKYWQWRVTKDGRVLDEPVKKNDDAIAALRYSCEPYRLEGRAAPATDYKGHNSGRHNDSRGY